MKYLHIAISTLLLFASCQQKEEIPKEWVLSKTIQLNGVNPIGIAEMDGKLWLSDGDHNRLVQIDDEGTIEQSIDSLDRPMHIAVQGATIFIPQYGKDAIATLENDVIGELILKDSLDAPAGIGIYKNEKAIADFYNNRILYYNGIDWIAFGSEGNAPGEFYYPTDVQVTDSLIWVADAYNNRIQAFDKKGSFVKMMGQDQKMNAATGILVTNDDVFVTDFENDRVLVFDLEGNKKQEISKSIEKATDMILFKELLHVINYRSGQISIFRLAEISQIKE